MQCDLVLFTAVSGQPLQFILTGKQGKTNEIERPERLLKVYSRFEYKGKKDWMHSR